MYKYLHDFRMPVENATIEITIAIENGWSLKLHQAMSVSSCLLIQSMPMQGLWASIWPTMGALGRVWVGNREAGKVAGSQVSKPPSTIPKSPHHLIGRHAFYNAAHFFYFLHCVCASVCLNVLITQSAIDMYTIMQITFFFGSRHSFLCLSHGNGTHLIVPLAQASVEARHPAGAHILVLTTGWPPPPPFTPAFDLPHLPTSLHPPHNHCHLSQPPPHNLNHCLMACNFLAIPGSSDSVEQLFSKSWHPMYALARVSQGRMVTEALCNRQWLCNGLWNWVISH